MPDLKDIDYRTLPDYMRAGARRWVEDGKMGGNFLQHLFLNQLVETMQVADDTNLAAIQTWAKWLYNEAPAQCYGSERKVREWARIGGLKGLMANPRALDED